MYAFTPILACSQRVPGSHTFIQPVLSGMMRAIVVALAAAPSPLRAHDATVGEWAGGDARNHIRHTCLFRPPPGRRIPISRRARAPTVRTARRRLGSRGLLVGLGWQRQEYADGSTRGRLCRTRRARKRDARPESTVGLLRLSQLAYLLPVKQHACACFMFVASSLLQL